MEAIEFKECNAIIAKDQPEYKPLPAWVDVQDRQGRAVFCWKLTWRERLKVLLAGIIWHEVLTFRRPLQPQRLGVDKPEVEDTKG